MQLERDALHEIAQVVRPAHDLRVWRGRRAANRDGPAVGVVRGGERLALLGREHDRGVAVDDGAVYAESLARKRGVCVHKFME